MTFREGLKDLTVIGHAGNFRVRVRIFRSIRRCAECSEKYTGGKTKNQAGKAKIGEFAKKKRKKRGFSSKWSGFFSKNLLTFTCVVLHYGKKSRPGGEMADATDLKSVGTSMRVRVPPRAFFREKTQEERGTDTETKDGKRKKTQKNSLFLATYTIKDKNLSLICNDAPHHQKKSKLTYKNNSKGTKP